MTREDQVITTTTPHDCCVTNSGRSYESSEFTIECIGRQTYTNDFEGF